VSGTDRGVRGKTWTLPTSSNGGNAPKELRIKAEQLTYAETSNMMRGIADDYQRIADIADAMAGIRRVLFYGTPRDEKAPPKRG
jgi:hypothetical protein